MKLQQLHLLRFVSAKRANPLTGTVKPETTIYAEVYGHREVHSHEQIHLHSEGETRCKVCGKQGFMIWTDSKDKFMSLANRCGDLPPITIDLT